jgi:hypothetical protein
MVGLALLHTEHTVVMRSTTGIVPLAVSVEIVIERPFVTLWVKGLP